MGLALVEGFSDESVPVFFLSSVSLKARNLLDLPVERLQGDRTVLTYRKGRTFSLGVSWSY